MAAQQKFECRDTKISLKIHRYEAVPISWGQIFAA